MTCDHCGLEESDYCTCFLAGLELFIHELNLRLLKLENMMIEEHKTSENMKLFFENIERLKAYAKERWEETGNPEIGHVYTELNRIYKTSQEVKSENDDI